MYYLSNALNVLFKFIINSCSVFFNDKVIISPSSKGDLSILFLGHCLALSLVVSPLALIPLIDGILSILTHALALSVVLFPLSRVNLITFGVRVPPEALLDPKLVLPPVLLLAVEDHFAAPLELLVDQLAHKYIAIFINKHAHAFPEALGIHVARVGATVLLVGLHHVGQTCGESADLRLSQEITPGLLGKLELSFGNGMVSISVAKVRGAGAFTLDFNDF